MKSFKVICVRSEFMGLSLAYMGAVKGMVYDVDAVTSHCPNEKKLRYQITFDRCISKYSLESFNKYFKTLTKVGSILYE